MSKYDARMLSVEAKEALRLRVVRAVVDDGMPQGEAARVFQVSRTSVWSWVKAYQAKGEKGLATKPMGRPKRSRLAGHQAASVVRTIQDRCPDQAKLPFVLWTREAVCELIQRRCGIKISVWTAGRYLKQWGFTAQKPVRRAYERDPVAVKAWLEREYPAIQKAAKQERAEIHWGDEMGLRSDHQCGTSYGRRGQTPVVRATGRRFGCNMISTITNLGTLRFMVFKQRFTAPLFLPFLARLVRSVKRKVYLIVDSHPVHTSGKVKRWVADHADRIALFYLPGYSPELNPDEYLNNDVKANATVAARPHNQQQMMHQVREYLRATQRDRQLVQRYFHAPDVRYAACPDAFNTSCPE
jgi:transposase